MGVNSGDIRQLAGYLEGEGHFRWDRRPVIQVSATDQDAVAWAANILGSSLRGPYISKCHDGSEGKRKPLWLAGVYGSKAAGWMMTLYKLMGQRRRLQIKDSLALWRSRRSRFHG